MLHASAMRVRPRLSPSAQQPRHEDTAVGRGLAGAQMGEAVGKLGPACDLGQQIGDADARQHGVEPCSQDLCLRHAGAFLLRR